jgi:hypothetical protein
MRASQDEVICRKGRALEAWETANIISLSAQLPIPFIFGPLRISVSIILSSPYTSVRALISRLMRSRTDDDPLAAVLTPPHDESPEARAIRVSREEEALRVSQAIDESIRIERQMNKKNKIVRILLLGQSESGARYSRSLP